MNSGEIISDKYFRKNTKLLRLKIFIHFVDKKKIQKLNFTEINVIKCP